MKNTIKMAIAITTVLFLSSNVFAGPSKGKYYFLQAEVSKLYLSVQNSARVKLPVVQKAHKSDSQRWRFAPEGNGYYYIISKVTGNYLQVGNNSNESKAVIWDNPNIESKYQKWKLEKAGEGYHYIRSKGSGLYLTVKLGSRTDRGSKADGATIWQYALNKTNTQKWKLIDAGKVDNINKAISASLHEYEVDRLYLLGHKFNFGDKNHGTPLKVTKLAGGKTQINGVFVRSLRGAFDDTYRFEMVLNANNEIIEFTTRNRSYHGFSGYFTSAETTTNHGKLTTTRNNKSASDIFIGELYDKTKSKARRGYSWEAAADEIAYLLAVVAYNQR